jgi:hypothetical protein
MDPFRGGMKGWGVSLFLAKGGTPFSARRKKILTFQVILGTFVAQKVLRDSKIALDSLLGSF